MSTTPGWPSQNQWGALAVEWPVQVLAQNSLVATFSCRVRGCAHDSVLVYIERPWIYLHHRATLPSLPNLFITRGVATCGFLVTLGGCLGGRVGGSEDSVVELGAHDYVFDPVLEGQFAVEGDKARLAEVVRRLVKDKLATLVNEGREVDYRHLLGACAGPAPEQHCSRDGVGGREHEPKV